MRAAAALALLLPAANGGAGFRASQGLGRDTKCLLPPPPLRDAALTATADDAAPSHLKYLGLDGVVGDDKAAADASGTPWVNFGFMTPDPAHWGTNPWNLTRLRHQKAKGVSMCGSTPPSCPALPCPGPC